MTGPTRGAGRRGHRSLSARVIGRMRERRDPRAPRLRMAPGGRGAEGRPPESRAASPIFVIGCQRSGTSLLRRILDSHPSIACPPESKFILPAVQVLRDRAAMSGLDSMGYGRDEVVASLRSFVSGFFEGYARARGKPRWADKTPNYVDCLPELWELFGPDGRFVMIVRNGLDVAYSLADPARHFPAIDEHVRAAGGSVAIGAGRYWSDQNERIDAFRLDHPDACLRIRYEDLTERPEETLQAMFEFLGETWDPSVLDYNSAPHHSGFEDPDVRRRRTIEPNSGRADAWPDDVRVAVAAACEPSLSKLGYAAG
jgi:protein-tyrosine sulfotransferase